jgi:hypothetical protein
MLNACVCVHLFLCKRMCVSCTFISIVINVRLLIVPQWHVWLTLTCVCVYMCVCIGQNLLTVNDIIIDRCVQKVRWCCYPSRIILDTYSVS